MSKRSSVLLLAAAIVAMPAVCFANDQVVVDNGPLAAGQPASVHEAQVEGIAPEAIAVVAAVVIVTTVILVGDSSSATGTH